VATTHIHGKMPYINISEFTKQSISLLLLIVIATHTNIIHASEDSRYNTTSLISSPKEVKLWNTTHENRTELNFATLELVDKQKVAYTSDKDVDINRARGRSRIEGTNNGDIDGSFWWTTPGPQLSPEPLVTEGDHSMFIPFELQNSTGDAYRGFYYDITSGNKTTDPFGTSIWEPKDNAACNKKCVNRNSFYSTGQLEACGCDEDCGVRGDCCEDAPPEYQERPRNHYIECIMGEYKSRGTYGIRRCPDDTPNSLSEKCLKTVKQEDYTYIMDIPVISRETGIYYSNIYCAHCHGDDADVKESIFQFSCPNIPLPLFADVSLNMIYQPGKLKFTQNISETDIVHKSNISKDFWEIIKDIGHNGPLECEIWIADFPNSSLCVNYINTCPSSFKNNTINKKCQSSTHIVVDDITRTYYKNRDCAICNNVKEEDIICEINTYNLRSYGGIAYGAPPFYEIFNTNTAINNNKTHDSLVVNSTSIKHENIEKSILTASLFTISLICMIIHMILFFFLPERRNVHSMNLFCLTLSLFVAEFLFLAFTLSTENYIGCYISAVIMYFAFTAGFFWMNVMSFDIYKTFSSKQYSIKSTKTFGKYSMYAWGSAILFSFIVVIVDISLPADSVLKPDFGNESCWFNRSNLYSMITFFILPSSIIIISNFIIYIKTVFVIYKQFQDAKFATSPPTSSTSLEEIRYESNGSLSISHERNFKENRLPIKTEAEIKKEKDRKLQWRQFVVFSKLAVIMGLSWIFGIFFAITGSKVFGLIFTITTSLQGTFIFMIFDFKFEILFEIRNKLLYKCRKK
ncbi:unnamed protein product, partial [Meganyctiphanes norvegica]